MSLVDPLLACRFCMRVAGHMRPLPIAQLPNTDIPQLYETVTAIKLDLRDGYSELLCTDCEHRLRAAAQTREDFVRIAHQWDGILAANAESECVPAPGFVDVTEVKVELDEEEVVMAMRANTEKEATKNKKKKKKNATDVDPDAVNIDEDSIGAERFLVNDQDDWGKYCSDDNDNNAAEQEEEEEELVEPEDPQQSETVVSPNVAPSVAAGSTKSKSRTPSLGRARYCLKEKMYTEPLTCDICGSVLSTRSILLGHMMRKHMPKPDPTVDSTTCHICGKTNLKSLVHHMRDHRRAEQYKCRHCPKTFCRNEMREQHERTHTGERPFICEVCAFTFTSPTGLKRHMQLRHSAKGKHSAITQRPQRPQILRPRIVPPTDASGESTGPVRPKKLQTPAAGYRLACPMCCRTYANRPSLHTHLKIQHGAEGVVRWRQYLATVCPVCGLQFADIVGLMEHRVVHQPFQCEICRRRFESKASFELHVKKHPAKERRFKCGVCGALMGCTFSLKMHHRRAHTNIRPFACTHCDRSFAENAEMMAHVRKQHTQGSTHRTFACKLCPAETPAFRTAEALRSHMENHTGEYRYKCEVCFRRQTSAMQLLEHMRGYHPEQLLLREAAEAAEAARAASAFYA